jgi:uncharacterized circularly permuted ATP-grasp superfamily protein/uncharacterized alpha-E superfamily protein
MGFSQFSRCWHTGHQLIQANGITYNVSTDPQGAERPWPMDPIPLPIDTADWTAIEQAVIQRATLLNLMLRDLYQERRLVLDRHVPAALIFDNPNFLRPCFGITPPQGVHLHTYAVDLARAPDGRWWVVSDRTQAPSGIGYALENRLVSARILPTVFSQCHVRPLTRFFEVKRNALLSLSRRDTPRIVLLTPGPHNETYFEHSFLAGHWGFTLVEGADLTVRDNRVYLKTLAGLEPVDVIVRRLDDAFCDPLELRGDSLLGVPGLVQAIRSGSVAVDNALGSGVMETPAHMAFLPGMCRQLLGEDLRMPSVATWWCGQEEPRRYVIEHLDELVIKPAFRRFGLRPEFPESMNKAARADLVRRIEAQPELFVAQERVALSTAPVRTDKGLVARHLMLRVFAVWDGQSYTVLPGGLTRVSTEGTSVVSMQLGGGSKDTWIFETRGETEPPAPKVPARLAHLNGAHRSSLPSRVADNLYWLGRYAERVESGVRLVRTLLPALSGEEDFGRAASLDTVIRLLHGLNYLPPEVPKSSLGEQRWRVQRLLTELVYDTTRTYGLGWNLKQMRRVVWHLKERLSPDTWRVLQQLERDFSKPAPAQLDQRLASEMSLLDGVIVTLAALSGLIMENITRGPGWRFLDIGRRLERSLQLAELLRSGLAETAADAEPYLQIMLHIADSSITYRTRYLTVLRTDLVLDLLLSDETNPRSLAFQLTMLQDHIEKLPVHEDDGRHSLEERLALKALTAVRLASREELAQADKEGRLPALAELIQHLKGDLFELSDTLTAQYLSHIMTARLTSSF